MSDGGGDGGRGRRAEKKRLAHLRYIHHQEMYHRSNWWVWGLLAVVLVFVAIWAVSAFAYPRGYGHHHGYYNGPLPPAAKAGDKPFVFKKFAAKRTTRSQCMSGEHWDDDVKMCAPDFHSPLAFDGSIMNASARACDSFFDSMCGKWNAEHTNEDRSFSYGYHRNKALIERIILKSPAASEPIGRFYQSCVSVFTVGAHNTREADLEMRHILDVIDGGFRTYADLPSVLGKLARQGYTGPFAFSIEKHPTEPRMIPLITWDGFKGINEGNITMLFQNTRAATNYNMIQLLDKTRRVKKVLAEFERQNTEPVEEIVDYQDYVRTGFDADTMKYAELPVWRTPHENRGGWASYFQAMDGSSLQFSSEQTVWVIGKPYIRWLFGEGMRSMEINDWKAFIEFSILYNSHMFTPELPDNVYYRKWDSQGHVTGADSRLYQRIARADAAVVSPAEHCAAITQYMVPGLVAERFLQTMPHKEAIRKDVRDMAKRIIDVYAESVQSTPWLADDAKAIAVNKIRSIIIRVAEPDDWIVEPFADRLVVDRYAHNMNLVRRYRVQRNMQLWHSGTNGAVDRNALAFFACPLSTVNAYYSGSTNTITILAGVLQEPFYSHSYGEVSRHAILGSIVGHELGHALDYHGLSWDAQGSLRLDGIWNTTTMAAYAQRVQMISSDFGPAPEECGDQPVPYGRSTLNERMADLVGIRLAFKAYFEKTAAGRAAGTGDHQYFYMVFAQNWCSTYDKKHKCASVANDVHPISEYRVDHTVRNIGQWQKAFGCHAGNAMYRAPGDEIRVWG